MLEWVIEEQNQMGRVVQLASRSPTHSSDWYGLHPSIGVPLELGAGPSNSLGAEMGGGRPLSAFSLGGDGEESICLNYYYYCYYFDFF